MAQPTQTVVKKSFLARLAADFEYTKIFAQGAIELLETTDDVKDSEKFRACYMMMVQFAKEGIELTREVPVKLSELKNCTTALLREYEVAADSPCFDMDGFYMDLDENRQRIIANDAALQNVIDPPVSHVR